MRPARADLEELIDRFAGEVQRITGGRGLPRELNSQLLASLKPRPKRRGRPKESRNWPAIRKGLRETFGRVGKRNPDGAVVSLAQARRIGAERAGISAKTLERVIKDGPASYERPCSCAIYPAAPPPPGSSLGDVLAWAFSGGCEGCDRGAWVPVPDDEVRRLLLDHIEAPFTEAGIAPNIPDTVDDE
jgi:hypothetical protein